MQAAFQYTDGSTVTLTVAYYNPPYSANYHGIGIKPDITVELPEPEFNTETGKYLPVEDTQLDRAVLELKNLINANKT